MGGASGSAGIASGSGGTVAAGSGDLRLARALPHHEECVDPGGGGAPGERLRVVAGGDRDHAAVALLGGERGQVRQHAAGLEGTCLLEELGLEVDVGAGDRAERLRAEERRSVQAARSGFAGGKDVVERDHVHR
jgi:hypothetical protein